MALHREVSSRGPEPSFLCIYSNSVLELPVIQDTTPGPKALCVHRSVKDRARTAPCHPQSFPLRAFRTTALPARMSPRTPASTPCRGNTVGWLGGSPRFPHPPSAGCLHFLPGSPRSVLPGGVEVPGIWGGGTLGLGGDRAEQHGERGEARWGGDSAGHAPGPVPGRAGTGRAPARPSHGRAAPGGGGGCSAEHPVARAVYPVTAGVEKPPAPRRRRAAPAQRRCTAPSTGAAGMEEEEEEDEAPPSPRRALSLPPPLPLPHPTPPPSPSPHGCAVPPARPLGPAPACPARPPLTCETASAANP